MNDVQCWCGNKSLARFNDDYSRCDSCHTLVLNHAAARADPRVKSDEQDFYGKDYWFKHQVQDYGYSDIISRSRADLAERCIHWLRSILNFKLPPADVLELGCGHGGFVAMLNWTGFNASGLELSPHVVEFARQTFKIPMLLGPLEDQAIAKKSLDAIVLMDVLEHLPDPMATMGKALPLLEPDGMLVIQTPCYPETVSYEQMLETNHPFLLQLKVEEHLFLFSARSVTELFRRLGAEHIEFQQAIFGQYDMFPFVSRSPLTKQTPEAIHQAMLKAAQGRVVQAMIDVFGRLEAQQEIVKERQGVVNRQGDHIKALSDDYAKRLEVILAEQKLSAERAAEIVRLQKELDEAQRQRQELEQRQADNAAASAQTETQQPAANTAATNIEQA